MEVTVDMDMDVSAAMRMLNQKLTLITDMADTEDMVDMDMDVNDDLLSPIMDMEATEDIDTDMDVKLLLENSEESNSENNSAQLPKTNKIKNFSSHQIILSSQKKTIEEG